MSGQDPVAQLIANPEDASSIPALSHTFMAIDSEIISTINILPSVGGESMCTEHWLTS